MSAIRDPQVLAYSSLKSLPGATNVGGVTATARKFIDNTRQQLIGKSILELEERANGKNIGQGR